VVVAGVPELCGTCTGYAELVATKPELALNRL